MGDRQRINNIMRALEEGTKNVRRNPSEQNYRQALSNIESAGRKSNFWFWIIGVSIFGGIALNAFHGVEKQPSILKKKSKVNVTDLDVYRNVKNDLEKQPSVLKKESKVNITNLDVYHNVKRSSEKNIQMVLDFDTAHLKNYNCRAIAYFYHKNGTKVRSNIPGYRTKDGQLSSGQDFRPGYKYSKYNNFTFYIPNKYFRSGSYKADVKTYCGNKFLGNNKTFHFTMSP